MDESSALRHLGPTPARPVLISLVDQLLDLIERARSRRNLSKLDDRMLRDIGLDRGTAHSEARKPFWRG
jgi:uncharacterized protein YjiS (DUF1127 family)